MTDTALQETGERADESMIGLGILYDKQFAIQRMSQAAPVSQRNHHYHNAYELYYLYSGERYYFIKDKTYHVKRGNFVLIKPYDIHCTSNFGKNGYDRCLIMFRSSFVRDLADLMGEHNIFECFDKDINLIKLNFQEQSFVENLLLSMTNEYNAKSPGYEDFLRTALYQLLLLASRHAEGDESKESVTENTTHKTVSEVAAYINNHFDDDITLESISERFFISQSYFSRTFKKVTGVSFVEYVNGVRIKEAQKLLAGTDMNISELSEAIGYKSMTHFGRSFKAIVGMSPSEYRRIKKQPR